jgi:hypothetical protein
MTCSNCEDYQRRIASIIAALEVYHDKPSIALYVISIAVSPDFDPLTQKQMEDAKRAADEIRELFKGEEMEE